MAIAFILIAVLGGSTSQSGVATITQEFISEDSCKVAANAIITDLGRERTAVIKSINCYKK